METDPLLADDEAHFQAFMRSNRESLPVAVALTLDDWQRLSRQFDDEWRDVKATWV